MVNNLISSITILVISTILVCAQPNKPIVTPNINIKGETIKERINPPAGYQWVKENKNSFGEFLQNVKVAPNGTPILNYANHPIKEQTEHLAILKFDVGTKNLQQCADAVIRLRAEYLLATNQQATIGFHFTSGDYYTWTDYKNGKRPVIKNNKVSFVKTANQDNSYNSFRNYLDIVYNYAGTISLNKETQSLHSNKDIHAGCILITPGSPGHAMIVVGEAKNFQGDCIFLLAQSYMPAQSIHIVTNPFEKNMNGWYHLSIGDNPTYTARYTFNQTTIKKFF